MSRLIERSTGNREIFFQCVYPDISIVAAAKTENQSKFKTKPFKNKWRGKHGATIECQYFKEQHGEHEMCHDTNLNAKKYMYKYIKYMTNKNNKYTTKKKCWCCKSPRYTQGLCGC